MLSSHHVFLPLCTDIDECRVITDACRGDMVCVNQNGGYLCIPRSSTFRAPVRYGTPYLPAVSPLAPPIAGPSFSSPGRPLICRFGYQMDENSQCVGKNLMITADSGQRTHLPTPLGQCCAPRCQGGILVYQVGSPALVKSA